MIIDWVGKKIVKAEYKDTGFVLEFDDGSTAEISAYVEESPSHHWSDEAKVEIKETPAKQPKSTEALHKYRYLIKELLEARKLAGGNLPREEEDIYLEELDDAWFEMTDEECRIIENELAQLDERIRSGNKDGV